MAKIKELITLMNNNLQIPVILLNQIGEAPTSSYITYQILDISQDERNKKRKLIPDSKVNIKNRTHVRAIIQFNSIGTDLFNAKDIALKIVDYFRFLGREELWENEFGVISLGDIVDRTELLRETEYQYICSVDITIEFWREVEKEVENLNSIVLENGIKISRK